jgi:secondary thiamine-phosphate synthase enzyme
MAWFQRTLELPPKRRGFHLITSDVIAALGELSRVEIGLLHVFIQHTSASLTINENADADVPLDLESSFNAIAPEDFDYRHTIEGPDDMPAHVKAAMLGSSVSIPVRAGRLLLGTWQGIYLCEHRNRASGRKLVLTLQGETRCASFVRGSPTLFRFLFAPWRLCVRSS